MLAPRHVIFTALEGTLLDSASFRYDPAEEALGEIERRRVAFILSSAANRAQLDPFRRKMSHSHPFMTENGGGLFFPDGYFSLRLEGATRVARYFCVKFGRDAVDAGEAVQEIAGEAEAEVVAFSQMSAKEIARNTGESLREAEAEHQCEFSEKFFFAGNVEKSAARFSKIAQKRGWQTRPGNPFWELFSGNDAGKAVRYLMRLYRTATRSKLASVGIGSSAEHLPLLLAVDHPILLPQRAHKFDPELIARLPRAIRGPAPGPAGWNEVVLELLDPKRSESAAEETAEDNEPENPEE